MLNWVYSPELDTFVAPCRYYCDSENDAYMHAFKVNTKLKKPFILCSDAELLRGKKDVRFATIAELMEWVEQFEMEAEADKLVNAAATVADNSTVDRLAEDTTADAGTVRLDLSFDPSDGDVSASIDLNQPQGIWATIWAKIKAKIGF